MLPSFPPASPIQAQNSAFKPSLYNTRKWFHHNRHANMPSTTTRYITILYDRQIRTIAFQTNQSSSLSPQPTKSISIATNPPVEPTLSPQPSRLLSLPAEIRHDIYKEVLSFDPTPRISLSILYNRPNLIGSLPHLALLQTCQQIYTEARLVPFECNLFQFYQWYGSSSVECRKLLEKLAPWQIEAIRDVKLGITECEIRALGLKGSSQVFIRICEVLGPGLRSVMLDVEPQAVA